MNHRIDGSMPGALLIRVELRTRFCEPQRFTDEEQFKAVLFEALAHNASDIYFQPSTPICAKINGYLVALTHRTIDASEIELMVGWAGSRITAFSDIVARKAVNARYELFDQIERTASGEKVRYGFRCNITPVVGEGAVSAQIVIRVIPTMPPTPEEVGLTPEMLVYATPKNGIVYIAGSTGQGKTTTFAAIIRHILEADTPIKGNLITYEEPVEFRFHMIQSAHSIISQTEVPSMLKDFYEGIAQAMRRAPALISIGELRDEQTIRAAVEASLTGHTAFGTVHAGTVAEICRRLISRFPESERATAIFDIVATSRLMVAQRLVRRIDGGLVAAREHLVFDEAVQDRLSALSDMGRITQAVKQLVEEFGHSFKKEADRLYHAGIIDQHVADQLRYG